MSIGTAGPAPALDPAATLAAALLLAAVYILGPRLLPRGRGGRFGWFVSGAAAYGSILLLT